MSQSYKEVASTISAKLKNLRQEIPDTMQGFNQMAAATHAEGALSKKTKELMAMAIGIAARCQGCLACKKEAEACVLSDGLTPVLAAVRACDVLVLLLSGKVRGRRRGGVVRGEHENMAASTVCLKNG